jgi:glycine C-acetyltransferase
MFDAGALEKNGLIANLVEYPAVARGSARFRFQVMASHCAEQIDAAVEIFCESLREARENFTGSSAAPETVHSFSANLLNRIGLEQDILQPA